MKSRKMQTQIYDETSVMPAHGGMHTKRFGGKIGVGGSVLIWKRDIVDKERITTD